MNTVDLSYIYINHNYVNICFEKQKKYVNIAYSKVYIAWAHAWPSLAILRSRCARFFAERRRLVCAAARSSCAHGSGSAAGR
jgi:hypothetical protein